MAFAAFWTISKGDAQKTAPQTSRFQSQQTTPTSTPQVSTVKPAQYEKGSTQPSTAAATVKPGTTPATPAAPAVAASTAGAAGAGGTAGTQKGVPQVTQQATVSKPTFVSSGTGPAGTTGGAGMKPTDPAKAQSTTVPSSKPGPAKVEPAVGKPTASASLPGSGLKEKSGHKVQTEVGPPARKPSAEADPFDALAGTLPSSEPVAPKVPQFTGPEVKESKLKEEKGVLCGEKDSTLPPGYRWEDLEKNKPVGVPEKPKEDPKPISTDDALDSLSAGFVSAEPSVPKKTELKAETIGAVDAKSAGFSNFAPPPPSQQKQQATTLPAGLSKTPSQPADKTSKVQKPGEKSTLATGISSTPPQPPKPKKDEPDSSIPADALSALGDTLGAPEPPKKQPELKPKDIVDEKKAKSEKGVLVGEREDTLPPDYRFSEEELKKLPPPPKEPSMDTDEALDILSGGFTTPTAAPVVKAAVPPSAPAAQVKPPAGVPEKAKDVPQTKPGVPEKAKDVPQTKPGVPEKAKDVPQTKPGGVPEKAKDVPQTKPGGVPEKAKDVPQTKPGVPEKAKDVPQTKPGVPEKAKDVPPTKPGGVPEKAKDVPPTKPGGVPEKAKDVPPTKPGGVPEKPKSSSKVEDLSALDTTDFVAPAKSAPKVSSAGPGKMVPPEPKQKEPTDQDAFSALGDMLGAPEPPKKQPELKPGDIEKDVTSEKGVRVGEREDTLPPDYRFSEEELKKYPAPPKEPSLDTNDALDFLSGDFKSPTAPHIPRCPPYKPKAKPSDEFAFDALADDFVAPSSASKVEAAVGAPPHTERQLSEGSAALDALSDTLADIKPTPQPEPALPKTIVKEKNIVEERISKPGERDDSLPPDQRFSEADRKAFAEAKAKDVKPKQPSLDDTSALDLLSSDFSAVPTATAPVTKAQSFTPDPIPPTHTPPGPALDELAGKLIPNLDKAKDSKAKKQAGDDSSALEQLSGQMSSTNVVPSSSTKGGKR